MESDTVVVEQERGAPITINQDIFLKEQGDVRTVLDCYLPSLSMRPPVPVLGASNIRVPNWGC